MSLVVEDQLWLVEVEVLVGKHVKSIFFRGQVHAFNVHSLRAKTWIKVTAHPHRLTFKVPVSLLEN
jgi:hypothetical protein